MSKLDFVPLDSEAVRKEENHGYSKDTHDDGGVVALTCSGSAYGEQRETDSRESKIDHIFEDMGDGRSPGTAILVRKNGGTLFQRGYGVKDLRTRRAIDPQTNFRLASCTKQFTAMAIMLLVHDGKVRYDERLTDVLPEFPDYGKAITIRNLLNHTSGLPDYEELMDQTSSKKPASWTETRQIQDAEILALLEAQKRGKFAPGTQWSYSNSGYVVLGLVVARVSGKPFEDFLHERIFAPLKMNHTLGLRYYIEARPTVLLWQASRPDSCT